MKPIAVTKHANTHEQAILGAIDKLKTSFIKMNIPSMPQTTLNQNLENKKSTFSLEEALIASEIRYRRLFESAKDGILILDAETGMIIDVNPFLIKLLGYSKESFIEKTIWEIGFLKDIIDNKDKFLELQLDKYVRYEDLPLKTATGRKINVEFVSNVYAEGRKKVIQCNIRDITDRKRTEEVLLQKTALLEAQINSSIDGIIIVDDQGKKILQNQRAIDLWKIPQHIAEDEDDSLQVQHVKIMTKNHEKIVNKIADLYEHPDISSSDDVELVDGTVLERYSAPVRDKDGQNFGRIWIFHDITERKRDELELIKAKEEAKATEIQLVSILENSPTGFSINSISTGKMKYVNKAFCEIYHIPPVLCQNVESFVEYVYADKIELGNRILDDTKSGDPERMKWDLIPVTDKTTKKVHFVSAVNIILKDQDLMISSVWDITSQVENEEKLIAALNKATESDRLKSAFLANMSHEIRTPMNGILGFAGLLKEPDLTGEEQQEYIKVIEKSGARMLNIISEIIDISKIESGQIEVIYKDTNINKLIENTYNLLKLDADDKGIKLSFKNSLATNETILKTDNEKLYSILTNLVKNAIKYTDKGSVEFGFEEAGRFIKFYVKDTGIGIPSEKQEAIFERFIQTDIVDIQARQGAGLGLSIAKAFVELLGGKIGVESEKGKGSLFYFTLPIDQAPKQPHGVGQIVPPEVATNKIHDLKILIAEDDEASEILQSIMIDEFSKEILKAKTGNEAVALCRSNPDIDLILMDIQMPGLNGYEATRQIRQFNKEVIIFAQTAFGLVGDREKSIEAGCNDYISKPIGKVKLQALIQMYFE